MDGPTGQHTNEATFEGVLADGRDCTYRVAVEDDDADPFTLIERSPADATDADLIRAIPELSPVIDMEGCRRDGLPARPEHAVRHVDAAIAELEDPEPEDLPAHRAIVKVFRGAVPARDVSTTVMRIRRRLGEQHESIKRRQTLLVTELRDLADYVDEAAAKNPWLSNALWRVDPDGAIDEYGTARPDLASDEVTRTLRHMVEMGMPDHLVRAVCNAPDARGDIAELVRARTDARLVADRAIIAMDAFVVMVAPYAPEMRARADEAVEAIRAAAPAPGPSL